MSDRAGLLARVSSHDQADGFSLPTQLEAERKYASERGYTIVMEFVEELSAKDRHRPILQQIKDVAARHAIDVLVVYDIDRFIRNMVHRAIFEEELLELGVRVEYVRGDFRDTSDGRFMKNVRAAVAEFEREQIRERTMRGRLGRVAAGHSMPGGHISYGYRWVLKSHEQKGGLAIVEEEATIVRQIFEWYVNGDETGQRLSMYGITKRLTELNVPTKYDRTGVVKPMRDAGMWDKGSVQKILRNERYAGFAYHNKYRRVNGKNVLRDKSEWVRVEVPPIISLDLWEAAQVRIRDNQHFAKRNTKHQYLMRRRLTCATCGRLFLCQPDSRVDWNYYVCAGQLKTRSKDYRTWPCRHSLRQDRVDALVWDRLKDLLQDPDLITRHLQQRQTRDERETQMLRDRQGAIEKQIAALDRRHQRTLDLYLDDELPISKTELTTRLAKLSQERERLMSEAADLARRLEQVAVLADTVQHVQAYCKRIQAGLDAFGFEDKRMALDELDIKGLVQRGPTPTDDVIVISGYIPVAPIANSPIETQSID